MANSILAPARLPLTSSAAQLHHDDYDTNDRSSSGARDEGHDSYHSYLHSLIAASTGRTRKPSTTNGTVFCVSLPGSFTLGGRGYQSLSEPEHTATMAAVLEEGGQDAPSSPPALSYSKSSKSSAESSLHSDDDLSDGVTETSSRFEGVGLEDAGRNSIDDSNLPPDSRPTLRRPPAKSPTPGEISTTAHQINATKPHPTPLKPMPNGISKRYPPLQGARDHSLTLPNGRSFHRSASSPTSPFMRHGGGQRIDSRSPSPSKPLPPGGFVSSPHLTGLATPKASFEASSPMAGPFGRRASWQPGRKSVKELEAEYNDADDEVPDDVILENIPISPLPGQHSTFRSPRMSADIRSNEPSPHRLPSYANLHSANIPKGAKRPSARHFGAPRSPRHSRPPIPHSATLGAFPPELAPSHRAKSWTEDLNEEARKLTQALEDYALQAPAERRQSGIKSAGSSPPRPVIINSRPTTPAMELPAVPAVQKGNIMIDPLPISKEKEKVLTRTRPSWLPPKSQKEEKKHLKEFQQMMARAADAEKKRVIKDKEAQESHVEMQDNVARIWEQHVLPNWDAVVKEPRTRELWWRGVTPRSRGEVWKRAIGNELGLTTGSFDAALARANALEEKIASMSDEARADSKEAAWLAAIARDVPAVFPEQKLYQPGGPLHETLTNVLKAYALYRSDVGYVYGTHLIAGLVCARLPSPADAFVLLANLLNRTLPLAFLVHDTGAMQAAYDLVLSTLKYKVPTLHAHLTSPALGLAPAEYLDPLFRCLFAWNLPVEHVSRLWDVWVFEGDRALVRAAVAVLGRLEGRLYGDKDEVLGLVGWGCARTWEVGGEEEFVRAVREAGKVDGRSA